MTLIDKDKLLLAIEGAQSGLQSTDDREWNRNKPYYKGLAMANRIIRDTEAVTPEIFNEADYYKLLEENRKLHKALYDRKENLITLRLVARSFDISMNGYAEEWLKRTKENAAEQIGMALFSRNAVVIEKKEEHDMVDYTFTVQVLMPERNENDT